MTYKPSLKSIYKRMGILTGNPRYGLYCEICHMEIKTTSHFTKQHRDYFNRAKSFLLVSKHRN